MSDGNQAAKGFLGWIMIGLIVGALAALVSLSFALPSDLIRTAPLPGPIALSGTVADSAKAIDATNPELTRGDRWKTPGIGYLDSENVVADQDAEALVGVPEKLLNFSESKPIDLNATSVGGLGNLANMTIINDTMVWH
jgi:hypothetical protein